MNLSTPPQTDATNPGNPLNAVIACGVSKDNINLIATFGKLRFQRDIENRTDIIEKELVGLNSIARRAKVVKIQVVAEPTGNYHKTLRHRSLPQPYNLLRKWKNSMAKHDARLTICRSRLRVSLPLFTRPASLPRPVPSVISVFLPVKVRCGWLPDKAIYNFPYRDGRKSLVAHQLR